MVRLILSLGILAALALATTVARRELFAGSPLPPCLTATMISLAILVKVAERLASAAPLVFWILCHLECPDIVYFSFMQYWMTSLRCAVVFITVAAGNTFCK